MKIRTNDILENQLFYRDLQFSRSDLDESKRTISLSFSSETPVQRSFGAEILLHGSDNVDLSRLQSMGSVLFNHDPAIILGRLENVRLESKRGRADAVLDDDQDGNGALVKVQSGSLKGTSVGYLVREYLKLEKGETWRDYQGPVHIATKWCPVEVSLTSVPADQSVGLGRTLTRSLDGIRVITHKEKIMSGKRSVLNAFDQAILGSLLQRAAAGGAALKAAVADAFALSGPEDAKKVLDKGLQNLNLPKDQNDKREFDDESFFRVLSRPSYGPE
jgi:HK97 family phage prohead protease